MADVEEKVAPEENFWGDCAYSRTQGVHPAEKFMSGTPICWRHWYWVKLDGPAADHWAKVAEVFLSNVDMYDLTTYLPACGLSPDEMRTMLESAQKVLEHSQSVKKGI